VGEKMTFPARWVRAASRKRVPEAIARGLSRTELICAPGSRFRGAIVHARACVILSSRSRLLVPLASLAMGWLLLFVPPMVAESPSQPPELLDLCPGKRIARWSGHLPHPSALPLSGLPGRKSASKAWATDYYSLARIGGSV
jgi:hypothetical protein